MTKDCNTRNAIYGAIVNETSSKNHLPEWACKRMDTFLYNKRLKIHDHIDLLKLCFKHCPNTRCIGWLTYGIIERYPHIDTGQVHRIHLILDKYIDVKLFDSIVFDHTKFNVNEFEKFRYIIINVERIDILDVKWKILAGDTVITSGISADNYEYDDIMRIIKKDNRLKDSAIEWKYL